MSLAYGDQMTILSGSGHPVTGTYVHRYQTVIAWKRVTRYVVAGRSGATWHGPFVSATVRSDDERREALRLVDQPRLRDLCAAWLGPCRTRPKFSQ